MDEAIVWIKWCPNPYPEAGEVEIRPLHELEDFIQKSGDVSCMENYPISNFVE